MLQIANTKGTVEIFIRWTSVKCLGTVLLLWHSRGYKAAVLELSNGMLYRRFTLKARKFYFRFGPWFSAVIRSQSFPSSGWPLVLVSGWAVVGAAVVTGGSVVSDNFPPTQSPTTGKFSHRRLSGHTKLDLLILSSQPCLALSQRALHGGIALSKTVQTGA